MSRSIARQRRPIPTTPSPHVLARRLARTQQRESRPAAAVRYIYVPLSDIDLNLTMEINVDIKYLQNLSEQAALSLRHYKVPISFL
uniref:Uncharacterized protein n=1 Tax=Oryza rufipogon TaxID=4529 RepID=A0A0E0MYU0_ORYRU